MKCELSSLNFLQPKLLSLNITMITSSPRILFLFTSVIIVFICLVTSASGATCLPSDEVEALKQIGKSLGKDWNFSGDADPCSGEQGGWISKNSSIYQYENTVNCSFVTVCHIHSILLKSQSLPGILPPELARLPGLQILDLTRNYLNGTIPPEWGSMQNITVISLLGNRLTGSIPKELGNISTLEEIVLEFNQLSGDIPPEIGNLSRLRRLLLTSNNFSGELPEKLAQLTNLNDFRIGDNKFIGRIPNFIENWLNLNRLVIQASGLDGPIPIGIARLKNLTDLRISDLNGTQQPFPPLSNLTNLKTLILRSCNISGPLPPYFWAMTKLKKLDLSFNKLSGQIPSNFVIQQSAQFIYLTGNLLNGPVPGWMLSDTRKAVDLSNNNFTVNFSTCEEKNVEIVSCLRSLHCPKNGSSFHINCGGKEAIVDGNTYEEDIDSSGPSNFFKSGTNWAFRNTGDFLDDNSDVAPFIEKNNSRLSMENSELYMEARLSPMSLTYYGFCLVNGNYSVSLHFAEIKFTDDKTFSSLGRRVFDIYIQGKLEQKDFNIEDKAGGVGKKFIENFTAVVTDSTLEIRLYWAGKGTTSLPERGDYGPLISAISVMNPDVPPAKNKNSLSVGVVVGIVAAAVVFIILLLGIFWWRGCLRRKDTMELDMKGLDLQTGSFTLRQIKSATKNFDATNKIGEGGFGPVYKGLLSDGTIIAVKQLSSKSKQGNREFVNEIGMISALQHPHLVKLYGCCIEGNQLLLVYEYMENNSLARALFGPEEFQLKLDWPTRYKICIGIARGLAYLHEESRLKIVHRDIKATNVLLDKNLNPKISDFGLAKLDEEDDTHISTRIAGTYGYMAPEYAMHGYLTDKADVYSFGIVALEIVSGRSNTSHKRKEDCLLDWAHVLKKKGNLMELVDPRLGPDFNKDEVMVMIRVALLCASASSVDRPTMSSVVSMLEGRRVTEELVSDPTSFSDEFNLKGMMNTKLLQDSQETDAIQTTSTDMLLSACSMSAGDLYPLNSDSDYWANRL